MKKSGSTPVRTPLALRYWTKAARKKQRRPWYLREGDARVCQRRLEILDALKANRHLGKDDIIDYQRTVQFDRWLIAS